MYPPLLNCVQRYKPLVCARGQRYAQPGPSSREQPVDSLLSGLGLLVGGTSVGCDALNALRDRHLSAAAINV